MNRFYNIFFLFNFLFCLNSEVRGQTQVIPSLEASAGNLATAGAIPYVSSPGVLNINAANLFWDNANARLGIGTNAPGYPLEVTGSVLNTISAINTSSTSGSSAIRGAGSGSGNSYGVLGIYSGSASNNGTGGFFQNTQTTGTVGYAMQAIINGSQALGYAGFFNNSSVSGVKVGIASAVTGAGTSNTAATFSATGGTANYGLLVTGGITGIGPSNTSPTGTLHVYDATASTGATTLTVKAGAGQSTTNLQEWQNSSGTVLARLDSSGNLVSTGSLYTGTTQALIFGSRSIIGSPADGTILLQNQGGSSFNVLQLHTDTSLSRIGAGIVGVGTGAAGSTAGTIQASKYIGALTTPASAAATCTAGTIVADTGFVYVCTATDTWKRVAIATW